MAGPTTSCEDPEAPRHWATADDLAAVLDLEVIDRDIFRGVHARNSEKWPSLFGGQVAAQALRAGGLTVPPDRFPHSAHGYFLRRGRPEIPVIFSVNRDRDGGSFSARHISALQDGEVIFSMLASFHHDEPGATLDVLPHGAVPPLDEEPESGFEWLSGIVDIQPVSSTFGEASVYPTDLVWVRTAAGFSADRHLQACALMYISDIGTGFGRVDEPGLPIGGPSIDHSIWFHEPIRADDWLLLEMWPDKAGHARGLYHGTIRDRHGTLGAAFAQEMLLRAPKPPT